MEGYAFYFQVLGFHMPCGTEVKILNLYHRELSESRGEVNSECSSLN